MNRTIGWWLALWAGGLVGTSWGQELAPPAHPSPSGVLGTLYASTNQTGRATEITSIHQLAGCNNRLFVAVTDSASHEILDVWDTRNASRPRLTSSVDFGSLLTNGVMFTPLALAPFPDGLLLQTRAGLAVYRFQADGSLALDHPLRSPDTGLGLGLTQLHIAGGHASMLQQVIPNGQIDGNNLDQIHREVLFDLSDPSRPLFMWGGYNGPSRLTEHPVNGVLRGHPASLRFDAGSNWVEVTEFAPTRTAQAETFWTPKLGKIFAAGALEKTLRELLAQALPSSKVAAWQAQGMDLYAAACGPAEVTLSARLLEHHTASQALPDVLNQYGIALEDSLEMALAKVFAGHLDTGLESRLSQAWLAPALRSWLESLLSPGINLQTAGQAKAAFAAAFNEEINEQTLARYLTRHVVSPLLGNPDFMRLTLGELLAKAQGSPAGQMIDGMLNTAGGFGAVNGLLDSVRGFIDSVPGVNLPGLPACAEFPDSTDKLLDMALFSWNDSGRGLELNPDGPAWYELLKFYRYLTGHEDFTSYLNEVNQQLREMQQTLAGNLASQLSGAFALPDSLGDFNAQLAAAAGEMQARLTLGRLMANALLESLPAGHTLSPGMSVRAALEAWGLNGQPGTYPQSQISDLKAAMEAHGLAAVTAGQVFHQAAIRPTGLLQAQLEQTLRLQAEASFGLSDLDSSLASLLRPCLDFKVGVPHAMGAWMNGLLASLLADGPGMSGYLLEFRHAFENHDCVARWLVVLNTIANASSFFGGDLAARALEYALHEGYSAGVGLVVDTMFGRLIQETKGWGETTWLAAQLAPQTRHWTALAPVPGATTTTLGVFAWQHRVAAVLQQRFETNWFGPRALKLVLCHPDDPEGTRLVWDLGRWQTVNYVRQQAGALWIGGSYFAPGDGLFPSGKVLLADLAATQPRLQRLTGDAHTPLASAPFLAGANHGACLAAGGVNRVFLIPNPAGGTPIEAEPPQPPRLAPRLANAEVAAGGAHVFAPQIHGSAPMSCQWLKDGVAIAGATTPRLELAAASATDAGLYSLIVSNAAGQVTNAATLTVLAADNLRIARHPANLARLLGQSATLQVEVESAGQPGFQWFHDGQPVTGAIQAQLTLPKLEWADAGEYFAEARLGTAVMRSQAARLTLIKPGAPLLLGTPSNRQPVGLGAEATLASAATGWGELAWQWFKDGQPVSGGTGAELNLGLGSPEDLGEYRLEVRDTTGGVTTHTFTVVLAAAGTLTVQRAATGELQAILSGGVPGQICVLQSSSNLEEWKAVETRPVPTTGTLEFPLPATVAGGVFFRIKVTP